MATTDRNDNQERNPNQNQNQNQNQGQNQPRSEHQAQGQEQNRAQTEGQGQNTNPNNDTASNQPQNQDQNQNTESRPNKGTGDDTAPFQITGNWNQRSTQLQQDYPQLTSEDLNAAPGTENELLNRLGTKLNKSRDEMINIINKYDTEY